MCCHDIDFANIIFVIREKIIILINKNINFLDIIIIIKTIIIKLYYNEIKINDLNEIIKKIKNEYNKNVIMLIYKYSLLFNL